MIDGRSVWLGRLTVRGLIALTGLAFSVTHRASAQRTPDDARLGRGSPQSDLQLVSDVRSIQPGEPFTVGLHLTLDAGWHSYWINAGDAGLPLGVRWDLPDGFVAGELQWPVPHRIPVPPLMSYGYEDEVLVLAQITPPANLVSERSVVLRGNADWLVCEEVCIPAAESVELELPVQQSPPSLHRTWGLRIRDVRDRMPSPADWVTRAWTDSVGYVVELAPPPGYHLTAPYLFVDSMGVVEHARPQEVQRSGSAVWLRVPRSEFAIEDAARISGVLVGDAGDRGDRAWQIAADLESIPDDISGGGFFEPTSVQLTGGLGNPPPAVAAVDPSAIAGVTVAGALLFALLGGLLLNLMPCVFPVLSIKILSVVQHTEADKTRARRHGALFGVGVVVSFWALAGLLFALRAAGQHLGWGFQLQSPVVVALLALGLFTLALSMSGLFEIGLFMTRLGAVGSGRRDFDALSSGALAVLVATPCTAPFMGAAMGFALVQPPLAALGVFTALGIGLATPYVLLSSVPALLRWLPRPGRWMETLKQFLAFPVYATVVWLVWVFARQTGVNAMATLLLTLTTAAFGAWVVGRLAANQHLRSRTVGGLAGAAAIGLVLGASTLTPAARTDGATVARGTDAALNWIPFSPTTVDSLRSEGRAVLVNFTAAWCLSCQVNDRVALRHRDVQRAFREAGVTLVKADWTSPDPAIADALASFGRSGVPLYVLYPSDPTEPADILPVILTPGHVIDAVDRATGAVAISGG